MSPVDQQAELRVVKTLAPLVRDLHKPNPLIYWADLAACVTLALVGLYLSTPFPEKILAGSIPAILGLLVAGLALYRASYFNHELAHQSRQLRGFELGWNLTIGIPLLIPSFLYTDHLNHHSVRAFGTDSDIEYFPPELRGLRGALVVFGVCIVLPLLYIGRFAVIAPIAWIRPDFRSWVDTRASGLGIMGLSRRRPPAPSELFSWRAQEAACFVYLLAMGLLLLTGYLPFSSLAQFYAVMGVLLFFHAIRIMVGHRYESDGREQDRVEQVLDSFNFTKNRVLVSILAPLGFRLHGLHHLFPKIPYHNMPEAHRRISAALPPDSFYHAASSPSYFRELVRFLTRTERAEASGKSVERPQTATSRATAI